MIDKKDFIVEKRNELYHIKCFGSKITMIVDELYYNGGRTCSIYDRNNYIGKIWDVENVVTEGFEWDQLLKD